MSDLKAQFEAAAASVQNLSSRPDNDTLLKLYSLYKQGSVGDVQGKRPGFTNLKGRAKYDAWKDIAGLDQDEAIQQYIDLVAQLQG